MNIIWTWKRFPDISGAEMHEILAERQLVFVLEQRCLYQDADEFDRVSWHLVGRNEVEAIAAYARICFPGSKYSDPSIGRVLVSEAARGKGLGTKVVQRCLEKCEVAYPNQGIRISAQIHLQSFYRTFGFKRVGEPYDDAGIEHIAMIRPAIRT